MAQEENFTQSKFRTVSNLVRRLQEALNTVLDDKERKDFVEALNMYHVDRDILRFIRTLNFVLKSPEKTQLVPLIRKVIPKSDLEVFDRYTREKQKYGTMPVKSRQPRPRVSIEDYKNQEFLLRPQKNVDVNETTRKKRPRKVKSKAKNIDMGTKSTRSSKTSKSSWTSILSRKSKESQGTLSSSASMNTMTPKENEVLKIHIGHLASPSDEFGFSIRGGSEYGLGIYVSIVDKSGHAEKQGLQTGDLIMEVNDITLNKISHDEAAKIIKSAKRLELTICRIGRIPGSFEVHQMYKWVNAFGRPVSPPPELEQIVRSKGETFGRKSAFMLLKGSDERKVNVVVEERESLGLMIRGGLEFALGIYISGVDLGSAADNSGLKVGDQILDVNGHSFLDITHAEAVRILKLSKLMMMTIKDVGKLPYARTTIDKTNWLNKNHISRPASVSGGSSSTRSSSTLKAPSGFSKGAGSQLMLRSATQTTWDMMEDAAKHHLNEEDQATMRYYLNEYGKGQITVDGLVLALVELFNTHAKFSLMTEVRNLIQAQHLDKFDFLVKNRESEAEKARPREMYSEIASQYSFGSSTSGRRKKHRAPPPPIQDEVHMSRRWKSHDNLNDSYSSRVKGITESDLEPLRLAIEQIENDSDQLPDDLPQGDSGLLTIRHRTDSCSQSLSSSSTLTDNEDHRLPTMPQVSHKYSPPGSPVPGPSKRYSPMEGYSRREMSPSPTDFLVSSSESRIKDSSKRKQPGQTLRRKSVATNVNLTNDNFLLRKSFSTDSITVAEVHHHMDKSHDNHLPSDDSGVEVNGSGRHDYRHQERVTISADNPVDIDDALSARSSTSTLTGGSQRSKRSYVVDQLSDKSTTSNNSLHPDWSPIEQSDEDRHMLTSRKSSPRMARKDQYIISANENQNFASSPRSETASYSLSQKSNKSEQPIYAKVNKGENSVSSRRSRRSTTSSPNVNRRSITSSPNVNRRSFSPVSSPRSNRYKDVMSHVSPNTFNTKQPQNSFPTEALSVGQSDYTTVHSSSKMFNNHSYQHESVLISAAREKYGNIPLEIVTIHKTKPTLGLAIEGGANTRQPIPKVINVQPGGSAYESGRLKAGHVILEVNGKSLANVEHMEAAKTIAEAFKDIHTECTELLVTDSNVSLTQILSNDQTKI